MSTNLVDLYEPNPTFTVLLSGDELALVCLSRICPLLPGTFLNRFEKETHTQNIDPIHRTRTPFQMEAAAKNFLTPKRRYFQSKRFFSHQMSIQPN
ncbi:MAG TPA: hypothetical protein VHK69_13600 [Chitinophagaceae bacterium]|nr:hypothetical protein [Chitinophagaceae bacterium]